jgi:hypothetical protein
VTSKVAKSKDGRSNPVAFNFKIKSRKVLGNPSRSDLFKLECPIGKSNQSRQQIRKNVTLAWQSPKIERRGEKSIQDFECYCVTN